MLPLSVKKDLMFYNHILQAGIDSDKLTIALEPEAAAIYVKHLPVDRRSKGKAGDVFKTFSPGSEYIVVNAGGMHVHGNFNSLLRVLLISLDFTL